MKKLLLLSLLAFATLITGCTPPRQPITQMAPEGEDMDPGYMHGVNVSHYLSQLGSRFEFGDTSFISEPDFKWLEKEGYDHIRLPVDGPYLLEEDGSIRTEMFDKVDRTIAWANNQGLNVLLDVHKLPGSTFSGDIDSRLFQNKSLQDTAFRLWEFIATRYQDKGDELRFEILNEPVSDDAQLVTDFYAKAIRLIRNISPDRVIHVCSNRWASHSTVSSLEPLLPDPNLVVDIHYYEPHIFTHQKAAWVQSNHPDFPDLQFPGVVPDLSDVIPDGHYGYKFIGRNLTVEEIAHHFDELAEWANKNNVRVYNGEFGVYYKAPEGARRNWYKAILDQCRKHGIGWAVWDYKGGFAIRDPETGQPTLVHETIEPYLD